MVIKTLLYIPQRLIISDSHEHTRQKQIVTGKTYSNTSDLIDFEFPSANDDDHTDIYNNPFADVEDTTVRSSQKLPYIF